MTIKSSPEQKKTKKKNKNKTKKKQNKTKQNKTKQNKTNSGRFQGLVFFFIPYNFEVFAKQVDLINADVPYQYVIIVHVPLCYA